MRRLIAGTIVALIINSGGCGGRTDSTVGQTNASSGVAQTKGRPMIVADYVLSWPNYSGAEETAESAVYMLNGMNLGAGRVGYEDLLREMAKMPPGSVMKIDFTPGDLMNGERAYVRPTTVESGHRFNEIAESRQLKLILPRIGLAWQ